VQQPASLWGATALARVLCCCNWFVITLWNLGFVKCAVLTCPFADWTEGQGFGNLSYDAVFYKKPSDGRAPPSWRDGSILSEPDTGMRPNDNGFDDQSGIRNSGRQLKDKEAIHWVCLCLSLYLLAWLLIRWWWQRRVQRCVGYETAKTEAKNQRWGKYWWPVGMTTLSCLLKLISTSVTKDF